jgi:hypothetical protein
MKIYYYNKLLIFMMIILLSGCSEKEESNTYTPPQQDITSTDTNSLNDDTTGKNSKISIPKDTTSLKTDNLKFGPAPDIFQVNMNDLFDAYMSITYSLCFSDPNGVKTGTAIFKQMQGRVDPEILSGEMKSYWNSYNNALTEAVNEIEQANDINGQRAAYKKLSNLMTVAIKNYRVKDKIVKRYDCPQVFNGQGAFWYFEDSSAYTLMNPYLGQESNECLEPTKTYNYKK